MGEVLSQAGAEALRTMNHRLVADVLFVRHRELTVSDADWQDMLDEIASSLQPQTTLRTLVKTDNAGPNAIQRNRLNQLVSSKHGTLRVAVMSSSVLVRGIVTAFSWMRSLEIKSFGPAELSEALAFLDTSQVSAALAMHVFSDIEGLVG